MAEPGSQNQNTPENPSTSGQTSFVKFRLFYREEDIQNYRQEYIRERGKDPYAPNNGDKLIFAKVIQVENFAGQLPDILQRNRVLKSLEYNEDMRIFYGELDYGSGLFRVFDFQDDHNHDEGNTFTFRKLLSEIFSVPPIGPRIDGHAWFKVCWDIHDDIHSVRHGGSVMGILG